MPEITARFADRKAAKRLTGKKRVSRRIPGESGEILVLTPALSYDDTVTLGLKSILGIKCITVEGIRP
ncbi:hypothetical protein [[Clostridium] hylemonae]|uniref:Uncharacterized protein n=1 Tax=[Clostridium] hylemonae DSM 15053 TaxID=553973 RepID=C0C3H7_9FIRM|nr:hypothetical protein [[Clostridium] hylemonae]EEG73353.1 hypothetical protein CLOHYLEM_06639 [[Clostridium] hylemonae DSM 15053]BDF04449.1 hypothetical protein CE91St63_15110 [[Clostridium] hylemonae]